MSAFEVAPVGNASARQVFHVCVSMRCQVIELYNDSMLLVGVLECHGIFVKYFAACTLISVLISGHGVQSFCWHIQFFHHLLSRVDMRPGCSAHYHFHVAIRVDCADMRV